MSHKQVNLIGGRLLVRNVLWNLFGTGAPLLIAFFAVPALIAGLGAERFGVLMLAWMVVGYFSLFDMGLGRAVTKLVAEKLGNAQHDEIPALIWTSLSLMAILGVIGSLVIAIISPWLVNDVLNIPVELQLETLDSFYILAISIPIVISSTGLRGILEAYQRFDLVNIVRIPLGVANFLGPVAVLPFSNSLVQVVTVLFVARLFALCVYAVLCLKVEPTLRDFIGIQRAMIKPLLSFGGWLTISNIISPVMVFMDRFLVGAMISMTAVAYYATPFEIVTKLFIIPVALMGVMFPAFSAALGQDKSYAVRLYKRSINYIFVALFPIVLILVTFSSEGLSLWLGAEFSNNSSMVLQLLAVGVLVNSLANVPFGLIQGAGRPDLIAKLHMVELPFYLLVLWWLLGTYGIVGVAVAWVLRAMIDALFLFVIANKLLSTDASDQLHFVLMFAVALLMLFLSFVISDVFVKTLGLLVMLLVFFALYWFVVIEPDEKKMIYGILKKKSAHN